MESDTHPPVVPSEIDKTHTRKLKLSLTYRKRIEMEERQKQVLSEKKAVDTNITVTKDTSELEPTHVHAHTGMSCPSPPRLLPHASPNLKLSHSHRQTTHPPPAATPHAPLSSPPSPPRHAPTHTPHNPQHHTIDATAMDKQHKRRMRLGLTYRKKHTVGQKEKAREVCRVSTPSPGPDPVHPSEKRDASTPPPDPDQPPPRADNTDRQHRQETERILAENEHAIARKIHIGIMRMGALIARTTIPRGATIGEYTGPILSLAEADLIDREDNQYLMEARLVGPSSEHEIEMVVIDGTPNEANPNLIAYANYTSHNQANAKFVDAASEAPPLANTCIRMIAKEVIPPGREIRVDYDRGSKQKQFYNQMIHKGIPRKLLTSGDYKSKTWDTTETRRPVTEPEPRETQTNPGKSAADLRRRQREEVGDGVCPSSLCNSASLIPIPGLRLRGGAPEEVRCPRNCPRGAKQGGGTGNEKNGLELRIWTCYGCECRFKQTKRSQFDEGTRIDPTFVGTYVNTKTARNVAATATTMPDPSTARPLAVTATQINQTIPVGQATPVSDDHPKLQTAPIGRVLPIGQATPMIPTEEGTPLDPRHTTSGSNGDFWGEVENEKIRNREPDKADRNTGDWYIATKNEQGIADLKIGQHTIGRAAARNHIQAFQEHNWPESDEKYFKHLAEKAGTHVLLSNRGTPTERSNGGEVSTGRGVAIMIARSILHHVNKSKAEPRTIYTDTGYRCPEKERVYDGKLMACVAHIRSTPTVIVNIHAPHTTEEQKAFYDYHGGRIRDAIVRELADGNIDAWPEAIILGDINMVLDRRKDMLPPESQRGNDTAAHTAYDTFLKTVTRNKRIYDAYRYLHPQGKSMTREASSIEGGKRLDTINLTEGLMMHIGRLHDVRHTPLEELGIAREGSKTPKTGDHREVRATMRITDEPKPKPTWKQNPYILRMPEVKRNIEKIITAEPEAQGDPDGHYTAIETKVNAYVQTIDARERKRDYKEIHKYQAQLKSARKTMHASTDPKYIARRKEMTDRITRRLVKAMDHQKLKQEARKQMSSEAVNEKRFHIDCQQTQGEPILGYESTESESSPTGEVATTEKDPTKVGHLITEFWKEYLNLRWDTSHESERAEVIKEVTDREDAKLPEKAHTALSIEAICHDANIRAAIESLDETSMGGASGFAATFFKTHIDRITPKLAQAYKDMLTKKQLGESMQTRILSPLSNKKDQEKTQQATDLSQ